MLMEASQDILLHCLLGRKENQSGLDEGGGWGEGTQEQAGKEAR